jgi:transcription elongation factor Elf1
MSDPWDVEKNDRSYRPKEDMREKLPHCPHCGKPLFTSARDVKGRTSAVDCKFCGYYKEWKNYTPPVSQ